MKKADRLKGSEIDRIRRGNDYYKCLLLNPLILKIEELKLNQLRGFGIAFSNNPSIEMKFGML